MPAILSSCVLALAAFLTLLLPQAAWAGSYDPGDGRLPIWWSDSLELESLDQVEERLAEPFNEEVLDVFMPGNGITSCKEVLAKVRHWRSIQANLQNPDSGPYALPGLLADCQTWAFLGGVVPAERSSIETLPLDASLLLRLPAYLLGMGGDEEICWEFQESMRGESLLSRLLGSDANHLSPLEIEKALLAQGYQLEFFAPDSPLGEGFLLLLPFSDHFFRSFHLQILAKGDVSGDGEEDLLILYSAGASGRIPETLVLTSKSVDAVLKITDLQQFFADRAIDCFNG